MITLEKKQKVWCVSDNGLVRLYASECKAREEYFAIVQSVKRNTYFHPSVNRSTRIDIEVDCSDNHYIVYVTDNHLGETEFRQAWYGQLTIN